MPVASEATAAAAAAAGAASGAPYQSAPLVFAASQAHTAGPTSGASEPMSLLLAPHSAQAAQPTLLYVVQNPQASNWSMGQPGQPILLSSGQSGQPVYFSYSGTAQGQTSLPIAGQVVGHAAQHSMPFVGQASQPMLMSMGDAVQPCLPPALHPSQPGVLSAQQPAQPAQQGAAYAAPSDPPSVAVAGQQAHPAGQAMQAGPLYIVQASKASLPSTGQAAQLAESSGGSPLFVVPSAHASLPSADQAAQRAESSGGSPLHMVPMSKASLPSASQAPQHNGSSAGPSGEQGPLYVVQTSQPSLPPAKQAAQRAESSGGHQPQLTFPSAGKAARAESSKGQPRFKSSPKSRKPSLPTAASSAQQPRRHLLATPAAAGQQPCSHGLPTASQTAAGWAAWAEQQEKQWLGGEVSLTDSESVENTQHDIVHQGTAAAEAAGAGKAGASSYRNTCMKQDPDTAGDPSSALPSTSTVHVQKRRYARAQTSTSAAPGGHDQLQDSCALISLNFSPLDVVLDLKEDPVTLAVSLAYLQAEQAALAQDAALKDVPAATRPAQQSAGSGVVPPPGSLAASLKLPRAAGQTTAGKAQRGNSPPSMHTPPRDAHLPRTPVQHAPVVQGQAKWQPPPVPSPERKPPSTGPAHSPAAPAVSESSEGFAARTLLAMEPRSGPSEHAEAEASEGRALRALLSCAETDAALSSWADGHGRVPSQPVWEELGDEFDDPAASAATLLTQLLTSQHSAAGAAPHRPSRRHRHRRHAGPPAPVHPGLGVPKRQRSGWAAMLDSAPEQGSGAWPKQEDMGIPIGSAVWRLDEPELPDRDADTAQAPASAPAGRSRRIAARAAAGSTRRASSSPEPSPQAHRARAPAKPAGRAAAAPQGARVRDRRADNAQAEAARPKAPTSSHLRASGALSHEPGEDIQPGPPKRVRRTAGRPSAAAPALKAAAEAATAAAQQTVPPTSAHSSADQPAQVQPPAAQPARRERKRARSASAQPAAPQPAKPEPKAGHTTSDQPSQARQASVPGLHRAEEAPPTRPGARLTARVARLAATKASPAVPSVEKQQGQEGKAAVKVPNAKASVKGPEGQAAVHTSGKAAAKQAEKAAGGEQTGQPIEQAQQAEQAQHKPPQKRQRQQSAEPAAPPEQAEQGQQPNEEAQQGRQTQRAQRARQAQQALVASEPAPPAEQQAAGPLSKVEPTSSVRQRAREIVALLAAEGKPTPERVFRKALGNSADSSKALRWLLTQSHVSKEGRGGKSDPFTYTLTAAGLKSHQERMAE